jgi:methyl-accepting chemotaxis protein
MVLISNNGSLAGVTGSPELIGKPIQEFHQDWEQDLAFVQNGERSIEEGEGNIEVYEPILIGKTDTPWSVNINIPIGRITAQATQMMWRMIWIGTALAVVALALIWTAALQIARPIKKLTAAAQSLARGSLTQELDFRQKDEVGQLSGAFHEMSRALTLKTETAEKIAGGDLTVEVPVASEEDRLGQAMAGMVAGLREQVSQVAENAANLKTASAQMAASAQQAGQATGQIAATVQQIAKGAAQESESISRTAVNAEQMSRAITGVARGAQEQAASVARAAQVTSQINETILKIIGTAQASARDSSSATQAARDGTQTVQETMECMGSIKAKVGQSVQKVREMGDRSEQIGVIVEVIEDIASQTNLLALNAAIEAARAGEHGKGFAVVADEVRKLAERAAASTKEINSLVKGIQGTVLEAVGAMDESAEEVARGVAKADDSGQALSVILKAAEAVTEQAGAALGATQQMQALADELVGATDTVSAVVEENTASAEEMSASSAEVTQAIENIASVSEENSAAIEEVSASAEELSAQVEEVTAAATSLAEMAAALEQVVAQFRLTTEVKAENARPPRGEQAPEKRAILIPEPVFEP